MFKYDVIIVGGGIVGLTAASLLARQNLQIAVIDPSTTNSITKLRVCAYNHASLAVFDKLGILQDLKNKSCYYNDVVVWQHTKAAKLHFSASTLGYNNLGAIISNYDVIESLSKNLKGRSNVVFYKGKSAIKCYRQKKYNVITLDDGSDIMAKLLIGADGKKSWLRQQLEITAIHEQYNQEAFIATISTQHSHQHTAWQSFQTTGPLALLPLNDLNRCSIVWTLSKNKAQHVKNLNKKDFASQLVKYSDNVLGNIEISSDINYYPLSSMHASKYIAEGIALLGDAAHVIHPLAGQGVNAGIIDCLSLVSAIFSLDDFCTESQKAIIKYQSQRRGFNASLLFVMSQLNKLFATNNNIGANVIDFGLAIVAKSNFSKRVFAKHALGINKDTYFMLSKI